MSRVSYAMMNPGGAQQMTAAVRGALSDLAAEVARTAGITPHDILEVTLVGNPIMHHLALGIDPTELGGAPFALAIDQAITLPASSMDLGVHPNARVYVLPCIAGHVGADTAGMILAERPDLGGKVTLLVDVGTNAEIVLGNRDRLLACSSPTGPAFEGAQISCGQRAAPGAIERVRIDAVTLEPRYQVIGSDLWSDDPAFAAATAKTGVTGVCGSGIIEVIAEMYLAGIINQDGVLDGRLAGRTDRVVANDRTHSYVLHRGTVPMQITQNDVRAIQLAKAALYAGIRLLMDELAVDRVDRIRLAGAFGTHIDTKYAMILGMIPDCDLVHVGSAGNAAGTGARIALLDSTGRRTIEELVRRVEKIETAIEPRFQAHFVEAMAIPHKSAAYPELSKVVTLPALKESAAQTATRGRRGRRRYYVDPGGPRATPAGWPRADDAPWHHRPRCRCTSAGGSLSAYGRSVKVRLLGPLEVLDDGGQPVAIPGGRQRTLLALLALNPGRVTPADRLIDDLWGDGGARNSRATPCSSSCSSCAERSAPI